MAQPKNGFSQYTNNIISILEATARSRTPVLLKSAPGIGKTSMVEDMAAKNNWGFTKIVASTMDPTDVQGLPYRDTDSDGKTTMVFSTPQWAVELNEDAENKGRAILFIDELSTGSPSVQNALLTVIQSRHLTNGFELHPDVFIIAAMNPVGSGVAGVYEISSALANRFAHIDYDPPKSDWLEGVVNDWGKCTDRDELRQRSIIAAYIKANLSKLQLDIEDPKNSHVSTGAWPSRRSWDNLARSLTNVEDSTVRKEIATALIGKPAAKHFINWEKGFTLPDPEVVADNPSKVKWGTDNSKHFAILQNVIETFCRDDERRDDITKVMEYMVDSDDIGTDIVASLFDSAVRKCHPHIPDGLFKIEGLQEFLQDAGLVESDDDLDG